MSVFCGVVFSAGGVFLLARFVVMGGVPHCYSSKVAFCGGHGYLV